MARTLRRTALLLPLALVLTTLTVTSRPAHAADAVSLTRLQVEKKSEPVGVDVDEPRFSWIIESAQRGVEQESYRLRLATSDGGWDGSDPVWDSGVVRSAESANIGYRGPQLASATRYLWRVDVATNAGSTSSTSEFRTGFYDASDWAGSEWIGNNRTSESGIDLTLGGASWIHPPYSEANTPPGYFRKTFTVDPTKTVAAAELGMTADIGFSAFLNGTQVASGRSAEDAWRTASRVAAQPVVGPNLLAVRLNNIEKTFGAVVGKLTIRYTDGTTQDVVTDATWLSSRTAETGWHLAGYDTSGWVSAAARAAYGEGPWGGVTLPATTTPDTRLNFDTASWIIPPIGEPTWSNPIPSTVFRRRIDVPDDKEISWAQLAVTGDQVFEAFWNGEKVAFNTGANNEWQDARVRNVEARPGENALALALKTPGNSAYGGVLARVRIGYSDGTSDDYVTDASFKALVTDPDAAPSGWNDIGFDDSAWPNARAQALYRNWVFGDRVTIPELSVGAEQLTLVGASWIWTPESSSPPPAEDRAFRTTRESPDGKTATSADVLITADDSFRLWVNGRLVGFTEGANNDWQQSHLFQVDLAPTRNVFAVRTTNGPDTPAGLIAVIRIHYSDGTTSVFTTGTDWKASKTFPADFFEPGFDDSAWGNSVVQAVYPGGPWGNNVRPPKEPVAPAPLLRKEFEVTGAVRHATMYLAAGGYANVSLNGSPVSDDVLSPGFTDYDDTVQYVATDLTDQIEPGANALGMELGRGFYGMTGGNVWRWESPPWHDDPVVRAVLRIEYDDGSVERVVTDDSWRIHDGPTVFDDLYGGETYDARRVQTGYDSVGFDAADWAPASEVRGPKGVLVNQRQQPIRVTESLPAVEITEPIEDTYVVKFPRVLAGWVEITAEGAAGSTIRAQYAEKLRANGLPNFSNNGGFQAGFQTDRLILAGTDSPESWESRFSYKGFQYIQVTGWPGDEPPTLAAFTAKVVHTDAAETGSFESSSELMNKTHRAVVDTLKNNIHGIPTDTPMFEKNGWTGDAAIGAEMFMMNLDVHELFAKWMRDVHETRDAEGRPMVIAPSSGNWGEWGVAPPWHSAYVLIPWWLYQYGGDRRVIEDQYDGMKRYVDLEFDRAPGGIVPNPRLGDWVSPEASPDGSNAPEDIRVSGTAYLYTMLTSMQRTAELLGNSADAAWFAGRAATVKSAFNSTFLNQEGGFYRGNSSDRGYRQTHNVLALAFGLAPDEEMAQRVADSIAADVRAKGNKLNTGVLGTKYLLPVLTDYGHADLAYTVAVQTAYPSWGFMIENGATTMWEHWALEARSRGHYFLGTVDDWFYKDVAGIQASELTGYRDLTIAPAITRELDWARATTQTPYGPVSTDWRRENRRLTLDVDVPVGSKATIHVPADNVWAVYESGAPVAEAEGVTNVRDGDGVVLVEVGSGHYSFTSDERIGLVGSVIDRLDALAASVNELRAAGKLSRSQASRLASLVATGRAAALDAIDALRDGDVVGAARRLTTTVDALDGIDAALAQMKIDKAARATLTGASAAARATVDAAINDFLGIRLKVALGDGPIRPGDVVTATVTATNGGATSVHNVRASIGGLDPSWTVQPARALLAHRLNGGQSAGKPFAITVAATAKPGKSPAYAELTYVFDDATIRARRPFEVSVESPVVVDSVSVDPETVRPGRTVAVTAVVRNLGRVPVSGRVEVAVPSGWDAPAPSGTVDIPARGDVSVTVPVSVPRDTQQAVTEVELLARFISGGELLGAGAATLRVEIDPAPPAAEGYDHVDLGVSESEQAHGLTASPSSGTSMEAGLTRRYAGHLTPFSWFEFDVSIIEGEPFVLRVVETYDRAQTKRYKVYVDGQEVLLRTFDHPSGEGTETYEFVVSGDLATSDRVRVKFENQDDPSFYDPSIADVWTSPR